MQKIICYISNFKFDSFVFQLGASFSTSSQRWKPTFCGNAEEAVHDIPSGSKIVVGGFGLCGIPGT